MSLLSKLGAELKSLAFPGSLPTPHFSLPAYNTNLPGSHYDDHAAAGPLHENPAAAACFVALTKAFAQAHPFLEKRKAGNTWSRVDHPLTHLLKSPNPYYSGEKLFGVTLICAMSQGAAFWRLERDAKGDPSELWYEPPVGLGPSGIAPNWDAQHFIKDFHHYVDGQRNLNPIPRQDVIYFRHGLNVANPRLPWSPLGLGAREIAVLNHASSYTSAVMRNHGAPSGFISLDASATSGNPTPEQAESLKSHIEAKFGGPHNAGKTFVSSLPWKWNKVGLSPAEMVIDKIRQWPQETICALLGTPVIVALLPTGEQPTYQNLDASMRWWWDNTIIPLEDAFADEIETQLFPAFNLDQNEYRLAWDRSRIPALQEDEQAKHAMWREDYKAGGIDRYAFLTKIGEEADEKLRGVLHPSATPKENEAASSNTEAKTLEVKEYDPNQPRDEDGKWTSVAMAAIDKGLTQADLSPRNREWYRSTFVDLLKNMTTANKKAFALAVEGIVFHDSVEKLNKALRRLPGEELAGAWQRRPDGTGVLQLNGEHEDSLRILGIYAHETSHALDRHPIYSSELLSADQDWRTAWQKEIVDGANLSHQATINEAEGFAEFGRLLLTGAQDTKITKLQYPKCYAFWKYHGLR